MRTDYLKYIISLFTLLLITWTISCSGRPGKEPANGENNILSTEEELRIKLIKILTPGENAEFKLRNPIKVSLAPEEKDKLPDSVLVHFDGKAVSSIKSAPWECTIPSAFTTATGRKSLKVTAYKGGKVRTIITHFLLIYSDIVPARNGFKVIHSYPHDRDAFTQGLFYDKGILYEGTGQENRSTLRAIEPETGKVLRQLSLDPTLFGEGITLYKDRIYQVTYTSKVGFVYEKSTFNVINKIYYQTEGWGLTTMKDQIVMSDGTNVLYFYEPEMFTVTSRIEVYDNEHLVDSLNELEYINGEIWANIWMTDLIARIDPVTGKVIAYIDLKGILNDPETDTSVNVLNGIAFDPDGERIFVTGKNWPKLFEIQLTE
ncbi:MAG: glutaminyl-peptide cyclotransferase [Bacteroidales bacterium]|nr:glutaminyl-peptide cyclotransferase [Bacteroidales bacterium]